MPKLPNGSKKLVLLMPLLLLNGCGSVPSINAICDETAQSRMNHAAALAADGGPLSLVTGALLIQQIDAGCAK